MMLGLYNNLKYHNWIPSPYKMGTNEQYMMITQQIQTQDKTVHTHVILQLSCLVNCTYLQMNRWAVTNVI